MSQAAGGREGLDPAWAGSHGLGLLPRPSGKEEALCQLQEENRRLSREQERVSRGTDRGHNRWTRQWGASGRVGKL